MRTVAVNNSFPKRRPWLYAAWNCAGRHRRCERWKRAVPSGATQRVPAAAKFLLRDQPLAALGASAGEDLAAILGGHAGAETVSARASDLARLVGAFHDINEVQEQTGKWAGRVRLGACRVNTQTLSGRVRIGIDFDPFSPYTHAYRQPPD